MPRLRQYNSLTQNFDRKGHDAKIRGQFVNYSRKLWQHQELAEAATCAQLSPVAYPGLWFICPASLFQSISREVSIISHPGISLYVKREDTTHPPMNRNKMYVVFTRRWDSQQGKDYSGFDEKVSRRLGVGMEHGALMVGRGWSWVGAMHWVGAIQRLRLY